MSHSHRMRITVLGSRGSVPVCGREYVTFGGNTSCYLVEAGNESILLDAGSGLVNAPLAFIHTPIVLLSHLHIDHLLGLGMYERLTRSRTLTNLYVPAPDAKNAQKAIERLYSPPLWPLKVTDYAGDLHTEPMQRTMRFGDVTLQTAPGNHPGGCQLIKICHADRTLVYATDFEHGGEASARLAAFAQHADLLLYDGQYDDASYGARRGFGHSTPTEGIRIMEQSGVGQLLVIHHDPHSSDQELLAREQAIGRPNVRFAREGEVIEL